MFNTYSFANPGVLYLFILIPVLIAVYIFITNRKNARIQISTTQQFNTFSNGTRVLLRHIPFILRLLAIAFILIALARPQSTKSWSDAQMQGIDIILTLDISTSMLEEDFSPNRLEAAKDIAINFIAGRRNDRIGLVVFGEESFTQCPLTTDHAALTNLFKEVEVGMISGNATAIGMGLATAINRLKDSDAVSKTIILLSDGENNAGEITPLTAADIAKEYGIRLYTIGLGLESTEYYRDLFGRIFEKKVPAKIDEKTLIEMAEMTGGKYFRATSKNKLKEIYAEIDQLEKTLVDVTQYSKKEEQFMPFLLIAAALLLLELVTRKTIFSSIP
jgi:Ca-activated chloride channel family protein